MTLEDLYRLLRSGHVQSQGIVDTLQEPLVVLDRGMGILNANPAFFETFGTNREDTMGRNLFQLGNGQWDIPDLRHLLELVVPRSAAVVGYEVTHDFPGIGPRTMLLNARRLSHPDHNSTEMLLVFEDVTGRRQQMAAKDILLAEMQHRMKNLLAVVRALATQTQAKDKTGEQYRDAFMGRFEALLNAQDLSLSNIQETDLATIVDTALKPIAGHRGVITSGPTVKMEAAQAVPVSMVLHELTTNALKYGSLSVPDGVVRLSWKINDHDDRKSVLLDWQEEGGPAVVPPSRRGFGTRLIEFNASTESGGKAVLEFPPTGLHARIILPIL
jgi:PAS domain S-box-containing protein